MAFRTVKQNTAIVNIEPFRNQATYSLTECYLMCVQQIQRCSFVEIATNILPNNTWWCKLYSVNSTSETLLDNDSFAETYLRSSPGCDISVPHVARDCMELRGLGFKTDGVYFIRQSGSFVRNVYCDMTTDGGGWIVVQNRFDGSVDFNRDWNDYKNGFGDVIGEHWVGNDFLHHYTTKDGLDTAVQMIAEGTAFDGVRIAIKTQQLRIADEVSNYALTYKDCESLTIGDSRVENGCQDWAYSNNTQFTTTDRDNDEDVKNNCAMLSTGGWWYSSLCFVVTPNSKYSDGPEAKLNGIYWKSFRGIYESLKAFKIILRRAKMK